MRNAALELAESRVEDERAAGIAAIRAANDADGRDFCRDCGRPIPAARRLAAPFAQRCLPCQAEFERA